MSIPDFMKEVVTRSRAKTGSKVPIIGGKDFVNILSILLISIGEASQPYNKDQVIASRFHAIQTQVNG